MGLVPTLTSAYRGAAPPVGKSRLGSGSPGEGEGEDEGEGEGEGEGEARRGSGAPSGW